MDTSVDALLATALQQNMSFTEDRKRQHTPGTANRYVTFVHTHAYLGSTIGACSIAVSAVQHKLTTVFEGQGA